MSLTITVSRRAAAVPQEPTQSPIGSRSDDGVRIRDGQTGGRAAAQDAGGQIGEQDRASHVRLQTLGELQ